MDVPGVTLSEPHYAAARREVLSPGTAATTTKFPALGSSWLLSQPSPKSFVSVTSQTPHWRGARQVCRAGEL